MTTPPLPQVPARGGGPPAEVVGNGTDWTAKPLTGLISAAVGSFDDATGVTSETDSATGNPDTFSLQINSNSHFDPESNPGSPFSISPCSGAVNPSVCNGWQQFIYYNSSNAGNPYGAAYIEYWLYNYGPTCPPGGWGHTSLAGPNDCYLNTHNVGVPFQQVTNKNLKQLRLEGRANEGGMDKIIVSTGGNMYMHAEDASVLYLANSWQAAEFNIFGDCCFHQANFNSGATLVVRTSLNDGAKIAPTCTKQGFTGEKNNLNLVGTPAVVSAGALPAIVFTESNAAGGTPASCASSNGDTHLMTFDGLFYDFQASGDFLLVQADRSDVDPDDFDRDDFRASGDFPRTHVDRDFVVQARQASGAPIWPNASVNKAVATRMGRTRVAVCLAPTRLVINGNHDQLYDGESLPLPGGINVSRSGNVYIIKRVGGDIVRAEVNNGWINVSVDYAPQAKVRGLLGNANGNTADDIATRYGTVLAQPVSFADLYHGYGESWRVPSYESLLSVCGGRNVERSIPQKPFYANDLTPDQYQRARGVCTAAGVEDDSLLDACTLDVTVLGDETAARVFAVAPTPIATMQSGAPPPPTRD